MASTQLTRVHRRFIRWLKEQGLSQRDAAKLLEVSPTTISEICTGKGWPGRALANHIERATSEWKTGPIRSEEWDEAERRLAAERAA